MLNKTHQILACCLLLIAFNSFAQNIEVSAQLKESINKNFEPKLLPALDSLVAQIIRNEVEDKLISEKEAKFTKSILNSINFSEEASSKINTDLLNCYPVQEGQYLCQIAYFQQLEEQAKTLKIILSVLAHTEKEQITFSTPLSYYTKTWEAEKVGAITYHYKNEFRLDRAEKFAQKNILFASRFNKKPQSFKFFMTENYQEILKLLGFDYHANNVGSLRDGYGVIADEFIFAVMNNEDFSHDLFHYYSGTIHNSYPRNWVAEEGLAYSWGNAYYTRKDGEMAEQKELLDILKGYLVNNENTDLLALFENNFWDDKSTIYEHLAPDFKVGRLIASLICDEVKTKHKMEGINQLIACGSKPNHFDPFFETTNKLIGLNRKNFNKKVRLLIEQA